ncbi:hypothetical protein JCM3765_006001 [Sporobolomyces pararoseus]
MDQQSQLAQAARSVVQELESISREAEDRGMDEGEVSSWAEEMVEVFDLPSGQLSKEKVNREDLEWLLKRLNEVDTSKTLPKPQEVYNELRKRWQAIIARHPYGIAHRFESKETDIFHALMAWGWEFDDIVGHLSDDSLGEHIRDRRDVEEMLKWIDELGDLLEEDENCETLIQEEREATNETPPGSDPDLPPFLLPFRARHLLNELEYRHQDEQEVKSPSSDSPSPRSLADSISISARKLHTVYLDIGVAQLGTVPEDELL